MDATLVHGASPNCSPNSHPSPDPNSNRNPEQVCQREGLRAEANTLAQLATLAQNDVRACLNTLQFVRAKSAVLTDEMVTSGSIGRCKSAKNVFELWKQVFVSSGTLSSAKHKPNPHAAAAKGKKPGPKPGGGGGGAAATDDRQLQLL